MKKFMAGVLLTVIIMMFLPLTVFGASYSVDYLNVNAELRSDGSALVTEEWTVTFDGKSDGFVREIMIPEDNFESFSLLSDVSVSVDGNGCNENSQSMFANGTYTLSKSEDRYTVNWNYRSENETHVFSVRYVLSDVVKIYKEDAYFYCTAVNKDSGLVCRNVSVTMKIPGESFAEDYTIVESGSLAGKKENGSVVFMAYNTADEVKAGVSLPSELFDREKLLTITDDNTPMIVVFCIFGVLSAGVCAYIVYYVMNYRRLFRKKWEKKCRKNVFDESSYNAQSEVLGKISSAKILNVVTAETVSGADKFIVNLLELIKRGYITVTADGFSVSENSGTDTTGRKHDKNDEFVMKFFSSDTWQKINENPEMFYMKIREYNRMLGFVNPFFGFTANGKKVLKGSFELKLSAKRHEFILPEEISDDFFRNGKYTVTDLVVSLLNEYDYSHKKGYEKPDVSKYGYNMFMLRDIYEKGKEINEIHELELLRQKQLRKNKKKNTENYDDIDSV